MAKTIYIADDFPAINARMRELADAEKEKSRFVPPEGMLIMLSANIAPNVRLSNSVEAAFVLHMSNSQPRLTLIHHLGPPDRSLAKMVQTLSAYYPSVCLVRDEIRLSIEDATRLLERLRELSRRQP